MVHISTALEKSSAKRILPPGFKSSSKTNPKAVFLRPGAKNCQSSRLSNHLKLASCRFTVKSRSLLSISSIPKDTSDEETCWRVPTHRVVSPCIEEEWKNSLVDAVLRDREERSVANRNNSRRDQQSGADHGDDRCALARGQSAGGVVVDLHKRWSQITTC